MGCLNPVYGYCLTSHKAVFLRIIHRPGYSLVNCLCNWHVVPLSTEIEPSALQVSSNGHETLTQQPVKLPTKLTGAAHGQGKPSLAATFS